MVFSIVGKIIRSIFMLFFTLVGLVVGAVTGALIGTTTESGLFRGAGIGAISGAVLSIEAIASPHAVGHSDGLGKWSVLYLVDIITSLLSGRLIQEKVGLALQSAVESQIPAMDLPFTEGVDMFETCGARGMLMDSIHKLPKITITSEDYVDASGRGICCAVCLQDFQIGETLRRLPHCHHTFHIPCVDGWLLKEGSCPLCRREY